jgi:hypothetical protein
VVLLVLGGHASAATPKALAKMEFDKAQIEYKLGHFQEALDGYSRAYELFPAPAFLFNIGQCHKNLKNYDRAIFFFEGYLREEKNASRRRLAEDLVAESSAELKKQTLRTPAPTEPSQAPAPRAEDAPAAVGAMPGFAPPPPSSNSTAPVLLSPADGTDSAARRTAPQEPTRLTRRWWFWTAIGVGVLVAVGGTAYWRSGGSTLVPPAGTIGTLDRR